VHTRREFVDSAGAPIVTDVSAAIIQTMSLLWLLVALAVVVLSSYALTLFKLREYGVVATLGATSWRLARSSQSRRCGPPPALLPSRPAWRCSSACRIRATGSIAVTAPGVARLGMLP
jgi:hypothetical protein